MSIRKFKRFSVWTLAFVLTRACLAQVYSGSLTGVVTDPNQGSIPGAQVTLVDVDRGYSFNAATDVTGRYVLRNVQPGNYRLMVKASGFAPYLREGIVLGVSQSAAVDVEMQLIQVTSQVEVKIEAPLLATQDATLGQTIDRKFVNDLPLIGRNVLNLVFLSPGVTPIAGSAYTAGGGVNFISNGGRAATAAIIADGVTTSGPDPNTGVVRVLHTPNVDAVQEFKLEQNNFRADIGFASAAAVNIVTRSGTNQFHGTLFTFHQNSAFNANNWFNNKNRVARAPSANTTFGGVVGGPIKRDRTFFFALYNGGRSRNASSTAAGVPSEAMRRGDFGEICPSGFDSAGMCTNANNQLWDPYSGVYDAGRGGPVRQTYIPFNNLATYTSPGPPQGGGSMVRLPARPGNLIDPVAQRMFSYFPLPNVGVGTASYNRFNNYFAVTKGRSAGNEGNIKIDHRFTDRDMLMGKLVVYRGDNRPAKCFDSIMDPCSNGPGTTDNDHAALNYNRTLTPASIFSVNLGFARSHAISAGAPGEYPGFSPVKDLGLPDYVLRSGYAAAPYATYGGGYVLGQLGTKTWSIWNMHFQNYELSPSVDLMHGGHDVKIGGTVRVHRLNFFQPGVPAGTYSFSPFMSSRYPTSGGGDGLASFLMGMSSGSYLVNYAISTQSIDYAGYIHDKWRVNEKLTLNIGLRYEIAQPQTERFNRIQWVDLGVPSPLQVPGMGPLLGGAQFADSDTRTALDTRFTNIGPRVGIAYRIMPRTVLRAGYGIFYSIARGNAGGITSGSSDIWNYYTSQQVYGANGATPFSRFSDPFPMGGPAESPGNTLGLRTNLGLNLLGEVRYWNEIPQIQTWSFGFQRELPMSSVLSVNYAGTKGTHLYFGGAGNQNILGEWAEHLSTNEIAGLLTFVPNPMFGYITDPNSILRYSTVQAFRLRLPYPQFTGFGPTTGPWADSSYHALQMQLEKRYSRGLQLQASYTWAKSIDNSSIVSGSTGLQGGSTSLQDPNKRFLERSLSQYDIPQSLQLAYTWDVPFGRGRAWGRNWNRWLDMLAGGWMTTGMWIFQSGFPIALGLQGGQSLPTYGGQRPDLAAPLRRNTKEDWMTQYFANPGDALLPARFAVGNAPRVLSSVRSQGTTTATLALFKQIPLEILREGAKLEIRAESFNALNRPQFGNPNGTVGAPTFGLITSQRNSPRQVQLGAKLYW
jgi:hypothetical protein